MNYFSLFFISYIIAFSGALMPGPLLTAVISQSVKHGFKAGPRICLGHALLEALMVLLIILGFSHFIPSKMVLLVIYLSGATILAFFGIGMLFSIPKLNLEPQTNPVKSSGLILLGITMSVTNPYWSIWWLTIGFGLVLTAQKAGLIAVFLFFCGHILADLSWYSVVSLVISKGRKFISLKIYRGIIFACGLALISFSAYFALTCLNSL